MNNYIYTPKKTSTFLTFLVIKRQHSCLHTDKSKWKYPSAVLCTQYANFISPRDRHWTIRMRKAIKGKFKCVLLESSKRTGERRSKFSIFCHGCFTGMTKPLATCEVRN